MAEQAVERKLATILVADVAGYSRLMSEDEEATLHTLEAHCEVIDSAIERHGGRVFSSAGDSVLAEFVSPVEAVRCAIGIQNELAGLNADLAENRRMQFRIGINLDDVMVEGDNLLGDGVNVAARLQAKAKPGGIDLSASVFHQVNHKLHLACEDLGRQHLKNIAKPVHAYRLRVDAKKQRFSIREKLAISRRWQGAGLAALALLFVGLAAVGWMRIWGPNFERDSAHPADPALSEKPSLAVLPFSNFSGDSTQEYFADGLTDDLITDLSKISGLLVIARNSTFTYKDKPVDVQTVARELGVKYVLEGSARRVDDQVRVNAQLIDAATGGHLWAERYDDTLANIFALQDKITRKIVVALAVELTAEEEERVSHQDTDNIDAYDAFLLGWEHYLRDTPEDIAKAISHLDEAVRLDPDFARAHAALAEAYQRSLSRGWWKTLGIERWEVQEKLQQHMQLAEGEPLAHQARSRVLLRARQHEEAIAEIERGLVRDPNNFLLHTNMAWALSLSGRPEEAIAFAEKAKRLDPRQRARALWALGFAHFGMEQFDVAVTFFERAIKLSPKLSHWPIMAAYAQLGRPEKAAETREAYFELRGWKGTHNVSTMLNYFPYKRQVDEERFARGLLGAGVPGYYKMTESNKLSGEEIRVLIFGRTRTGFNINTGQQYWVTYFGDGKATWRGGRQGSDSGKAWIEEDSLCHQWQKILKGRKQCVSIYRNPEGRPEALDEYILTDNPKVNPWSVVD